MSDLEMPEPRREGADEEGLDPLPPDIEVLELYRTGSLTDEQRRHVEHHLSSDSQWSALLSELEADAEIERELACAAGEVESSHQGASVAGFAIGDEIAGGGQGVVYRAVEHSTGREVAIKLLRRGVLASARERHRFEREIEIAANLRHPNIVPLYQSGRTVAGDHFFVMPYIIGRRLDQYVRDVCRDAPETLRLFLKVTSAVHYAHQRGVLHRDLKPGNVLVDERGEPFVLDFGLAKVLLGGLVAGEDSAVRTLTGEFSGTIAYAAPEQVSGSADETEVRSDVYALGVLLFRLLTNEPPYSAEGSVQEVVDRIVNHRPPRPSRVRPDIDSDVDTIVLKAMSKEVDRRYATVAHLQRDIELHLDGRPIEAKSDSGFYVFRKTLSRYRVLASALLVVFVVSIFASVVSLIYWNQSELARAQALSAKGVADEKRREAEAERDYAYDERSARHAVSTFLWNLFSSVSPDRDGADATVIAVLRRASEDVDTAFGSDDLARAIVDDQLGMAFYQLGLLARADQHLTAAIEGFERTSYRDAGEVWAVKKSLGVIRRAQGRYTEAEELIRGYLDWVEVGSVRGFASSGSARRELGGLLMDQGRYAEAEPFLERAWDATSSLPESDRERMKSQSALGLLRLCQGRATEAGPLLRSAYDAAVEYGADRPRDLVGIRNQFARWVVLTNRKDVAVRLLEESLSDCEERLEPQDPYHLATLNNLAHALAEVGRLEEAATRYAASVALAQATLGDDHPTTLKARLNESRNVATAGDPERAVGMLRALLQRCRTAHGDANSDTWNVANSLGWWLSQIGEGQEGERVIANAIERAGEGGLETHWFLSFMRANRAQILSDQGRSLEAYEEFEAAYRSLSQLLGVDHPQARSVKGAMERFTATLAEPDD